MTLASFSFVSHVHFWKCFISRKLVLSTFQKCCHFFKILPHALSIIFLAFFSMVDIMGVTSLRIIFLEWDPLFWVVLSFVSAFFPLLSLMISFVSIFMQTHWDKVTLLHFVIMTVVWRQIYLHYFVKCLGGDSCMPILCPLLFCPMMWRWHMPL